MKRALLPKKRRGRGRSSEGKMPSRQPARCRRYPGRDRPLAQDASSSRPKCTPSLVLRFRISVRGTVATLREIVDQQVREGDLYEKLDRNRVRCYACGHCCPIPDGQPGVCKVRYNRGGTLYVPWGYVGGVQCDPIEKKPFFHAYPGALAYSFGMLGCDLHCAYCQNWVTSFWSAPTTSR